MLTTCRTPQRLFFSNCDIPVLFATVNNELSKISQWLLADNFSFNVTEAKDTLFHKTSKKDDIQLKLPRKASSKQL